MRIAWHHWSKSRSFPSGALTILHQGELEVEVPMWPASSEATENHARLEVEKNLLWSFVARSHECSESQYSIHVSSKYNILRLAYVLFPRWFKTVAMAWGPVAKISKHWRDQNWKANLSYYSKCSEVERDPFCQSVLSARMTEGSLPMCEIFPDVVEYRPTGPASDAEAVLSGFPCQAWPQHHPQFAPKLEVFLTGRGWAKPGINVD